jgi:hypothetical protein
MDQSIQLNIKNNIGNKATISPAHKQLKLLIWAYFFLLIFEGALRKWVLPGLSGPLLLIRDPLVLYILLKAWYQKLLPSSFYSTAMVCIGVLSIITAVLFGHGNLLVALFGARIFIIEIPLIFVIGKLFSREDVIKMGNFMLWIAIPMTILVALQFYSPQSARVNKGVGEAEAIGFAGALGFFRPSGTFSFTTGLTLFYSLLVCFVLYFWINIEKIKKALLISATIALIIAIPLTISRSLTFQAVLSLMFVMVAVIRNPKYTGKVLISLVIGVVFLLILSRASIFSTATGVLSQRFENAGHVEGGLQGTLINRFLGGLVEAIYNSSTLPFLGYGVGLGTNVGSALLTGSRGFLIAEGEWGRLLGELGPLMGLIVIFLRISLSFGLLKKAFYSLRSDNLLPWVLASASLLLLIQGQWGQPTSLGFCVLTIGIMIASFKERSLNTGRYKKDNS